MTPELTADDLFPVVSGYRLSAAIRAMADLGVPDALADGAKTAEELAAAIEVDVILLRRLLRMLSSRGALLVDERSRFSNSGLSASLRSGGTRDMVLGWTAAPSIFDAWSHISDGIRSATSPFERAHGVPFHDYLAAHPEEKAAYFAANGSTVEGFEDVADVLDLSDAKIVVSVGGGLGAELIPLLRKWAHLYGVLTDLPDALEGAEQLLADSGLVDRVTIVGGDARAQVPQGDTYILQTLLRCLTDDDVVAVLSACRVAGLPSVRVHVVEMPAHEDAQHPSATNDMTAWTVYGGADRTLAEWTALHARAGLAISDVTQLDDVYALMTSAPMIPARR